MLFKTLLLVSLSCTAWTLKTEDVVKVSWTRLLTVATNEMVQLNQDPSAQNALIANVTHFVEKELMIANIFSQRLQFMKPANTSALMAEYYSANEITQFKRALNFITFRLNFLENDGKPLVRFTRYGRDIFPPRYIGTKTDVEEMSDLQIASIAVESVILILGCVGVDIDLDDSEIEDVSEDFITRAMKNREIRDSILKFVDDFEDATDLMDKASSLFELIKLLEQKGVLWDTIKDVCRDMKWYQWLETSAELVVTLIAALATDGVALIAKIALALDNAVHFGLKFASLAYLKSIGDFLEST